MKDFWRARSWFYFLALAPMVIGSLVVLLPVSLFGLWVTVMSILHVGDTRLTPVPLLLTPVAWLGPMGLYGLWSAAFSWLALLWPSWIARSWKSTACGLMLGLAAAALGPVLWPGGHSRYIFVVYAILALVLLRGLVAWRKAGPAAFSDAAAPATQRSLVGPGSVLLAWVAVAGLAIPWHRYQGPFADPAAQQEDARAKLQQAFLNNPFAKAICADQPELARNLLGQAEAVRDAAILQEVLDQCLDQRDPIVGYAALKTAAIPVVLDGILLSERQNAVDSSAGCTPLQRGLLFHLFANRDFDGVQLLLDRHLRVDCMADYVQPSEPIWWLAVSDRRTSVDELQRLQALGLDLKTPNERGDQFPDESCRSPGDYSAEVIAFLRQQGFALQGPKGWTCP